MVTLSSRESGEPVAVPGTNQAIPARRSQNVRLRLWGALLLGVLPLTAQSPGIFRPGPGIDAAPQPDRSSPVDARIKAKRIAQLNENRQKAMMGDAEKLLRLAQELNEDANAGGANLSPAERMHKAAEIEKLAKGVKEKMTYAIGEPAEISLPFSTSAR